MSGQVPDAVREGEVAVQSTARDEPHQLTGHGLRRTVVLVAGRVRIPSSSALCPVSHAVQSSSGNMRYEAISSPVHASRTSPLALA
jgi:hypothetical protein